MVECDDAEVDIPEDAEEEGGSDEDEDGFNDNLNKLLREYRQQKQAREAALQHRAMQDGRPFSAPASSPSCASIRKRMAQDDLHVNGRAPEPCQRVLYRPSTVPARLPTGSPQRHRRAPIAEHTAVCGLSREVQRLQVVPEEPPPRRDSSSMLGPADRLSAASSARHAAAEQSSTRGPQEPSLESLGESRQRGAASENAATKSAQHSCDAKNTTEGAEISSVRAACGPRVPTATATPQPNLAGLTTGRAPGEPTQHVFSHGQRPAASCAVGSAAAELLEALSLRDQPRVDAIAQGMQSAWQPALRNGSAERQLLENLLGILLTASVSADSARLLLAAQMDRVLTQCPQQLPCYSLARHTLRQLLATESRWLLGAHETAAAPPCGGAAPAPPAAQHERASAHAAWLVDTGPGSHPLRDVASASGAGADMAHMQAAEPTHDSRHNRPRRTASGMARARAGHPTPQHVQQHLSEAMQPDGIDLEYVYVPGLSRPQTPTRARSGSRGDHRGADAGLAADASPRARRGQRPRSRKSSSARPRSAHLPQLAGRESTHRAGYDDIVDLGATWAFHDLSVASGSVPVWGATPQQTWAAPHVSSPGWEERLSSSRPVWSSSGMQRQPWAHATANDAPLAIHPARPHSAAAVYSAPLTDLLRHANQCAAALGSKYRYVAAKRQGAMGGTDVERRLVTEDGAGTKSAGPGGRMAHNKFLQLVARLEARAKGGKGLRASAGAWGAAYGGAL